MSIGLRFGSRSWNCRGRCFAIQSRPGSIVMIAKVGFLLATEADYKQAKVSP
jgi:hypothetical protein